MLEIFKNVRYRSVAKVEIMNGGYELITVHDAMMTDYDWQRYRFKLDMKGVEYRIINSDCILIIKKEKKEKES